MFQQLPHNIDKPSTVDHNPRAALTKLVRAPRNPQEAWFVYNSGFGGDRPQRF